MQLSLRDHIAEVYHRNGYHFFLCLDLYQYLLSLGPVFDGIVDQVVKQPGQEISIGGDLQGRHIAGQFIGKPLIGKAGIKLLQKLSQELYDVHPAHVHGNLAAVHLRKAE